MERQYRQISRWIDAVEKHRRLPEIKDHFWPYWIYRLEVWVINFAISNCANLALLNTREEEKLRERTSRLKITP